MKPDAFLQKRDVKCVSVIMNKHRILLDGFAKEPDDFRFFVRIFRKPLAEAETVRRFRQTSNQLDVAAEGAKPGGLDIKKERAERRFL